MAQTSADILEKFRISHGQDIHLGLRPAYHDLLNALGAPHTTIPAPILVAGTNGKGSTCAFLRAIIEAEERQAHVYTSPHLIHFHERIRIAGHLIEEEELLSALESIEAKAEKNGISIFEAGTAAALAVFARHKADVTILEVGLGGRLDATNIVPNPIACAIARLSFDHRDYLGDSMASIATEKAGIMRPNTPCFVSRQRSHEAMTALETHAKEIHAPLYVCGKDWDIQKQANSTLTFHSASRTIDQLPLPALIGDHQVENAGLAIATALALPFPISDAAFRTAMTSVEWPARLQKLTNGALVKDFAYNQELWIDGGHNDSAGDVLAAQMQKWKEQDGRPIHILFGMLSTKNVSEYLTPLLPFISAIRTISITGDMPGHDANVLMKECRALGKINVKTASCVQGGVEDILTHANGSGFRTVICGSLYLAGQALCENNAP